MHRTPPRTATRLLAQIPALVLATGALAVGAQAQQSSPAGTGTQRTGQVREDAGTPRSRSSVRFAMIGDYGWEGQPLADVAGLIASWDPDFIVTSGDNNYPLGEAATIDANCGQYFHPFIHPYMGIYGPTTGVNRFFPTPGNHDWDGPEGLGPYLDYFTLPGNEMFYDVRRGPVHVFFLDSDPRQPAGVDASSFQAQWLEGEMTASEAPFKVVVYHHPQWTSGANSASPWMDWPFEEWGADLLLCGHDHHYERITRETVPLVVNGLGGRSIRPIGDPIEGSQLRYNDDYGAVLVTVEEELAEFRFIAVDGTVVDQYWLAPTPLTRIPFTFIGSGAVWSFLDDGSDQGTAWRGPGFDHGSWATGPGELGYGDGDEATVVGFGPDPDNKYPTTYFRKTFQVIDPTRVGSLRVRIIRDDGAIVYVNGTEVVRTNMPPDPVDFLTLAAASSGSTEATWLPFEIDPEVLVPGTNEIAVEVHQSHIDSPDLSFNLELLANLGLGIVPQGATWSYLDDGSQPPADWLTAGFDDASWSAGPAQLGYGDGDEDTVVGFGPDPLDKYVTTYFRHEFNVPDASLIGGLSLKVLRDDGVAVYLNGRPVFRNNLPGGPLSSTQTATAPVDVGGVGGGSETEYLETSIPAALLEDGANVIAVEVHQVDGSSEDLSFDLSLFGVP